MQPTIFTVPVKWDAEPGVWCGRCDDIPAASDAPTLDDLLTSIRAITLDLLPDNHPALDPEAVFLQFIVLTGVVDVSPNKAAQSDLVHPG